MALQSPLVVNFIYLILAGIFIGLLGGMFGFGGSAISTPILRVFFLIPPYFALASPLPMTLISSSIAFKRYQSEKLVDWKIVEKMLVVLIPGSFIGAYATKYISGKILMMLTAVFLVYVAIRLIISGNKERKMEKRMWVILLAGFVIGLLSGLLANGGGILIVPILVLLGMNIKKAIGSSVAMVLFAAIPSILVHWYLGHIDWLITLGLTVGAIPGAYIGAWITVNADKKKLRKIYGIFLLLFSIYFAIFEIFSG